jgi:flagellar protein FliO/FliZ
VIDVWDSIARTLMALAIVLLLMGVVAWAARRVLAHRVAAPGGVPLIRVVANSYLAPRKSIALVAIAGQYFVVGLTADNLIPLGRIEDQSSIATLLSSAGHTGLPSGLSPHSMLHGDWWQDVAKTVWPGKKSGPNV